MDNRIFVREIIQKAKDDINDFESGNGNFEPSDVVIVTWNGTLPDFCDFVPSCSCSAAEVKPRLVNFNGLGTKFWVKLNFMSRAF